MAAVMGIILVTMGSAPASAQGDPTAYPAQRAAPASVRPVVAAAARPLVPAAAQAGVTAAIRTVSRTFGQDGFVTEASWLHKGGWPLHSLVEKFATSEQLDEQMTCLATAVYFEARGESVEGQLAVARVVMNRAASGKYPSSWCATVKQPWQFSFVRNGIFPRVDRNSAIWARAQAVAKIAAANIVPSLSNDVLWYHADYVAPGWGRRLTKVNKIGAHIFYRS